MEDLHMIITQYYIDVMQNRVIIGYTINCLQQVYSNISKFLTKKYIQRINILKTTYQKNAFDYLTEACNYCESVITYPFEQIVQKTTMVSQLFCSRIISRIKTQLVVFNQNRLYQIQQYLKQVAIAKLDKSFKSDTLIQILLEVTIKLLLSLKQSSNLIGMHKDVQFFQEQGFQICYDRVFSKIQKIDKKYLSDKSIQEIKQFQKYGKKNQFKQSTQSYSPTSQSSIIRRPRKRTTLRVTWKATTQLISPLQKNNLQQCFGSCKQLQEQQQRQKQQQHKKHRGNYRIRKRSFPNQFAITKVKRNRSQLLSLSLSRSQSKIEYNQRSNSINTNGREVKIKKALPLSQFNFVNNDRKIRLHSSKKMLKKKSSKRFTIQSSSPSIPSKKLTDYSDYK